MLHVMMMIVREVEDDRSSYSGDEYTDGEYFSEDEDGVPRRHMPCSFTTIPGGRGTGTAMRQQCLSEMTSAAAPRAKWMAAVSTDAAAEANGDDGDDESVEVPHKLLDNDNGTYNVSYAAPAPGPPRRPYPRTSFIGGEAPWCRHQAPPAGVRGRCGCLCAQAGEAALLALRDGAEPKGWRGDRRVQEDGALGCHV